ncbi:MAG TPA: hypothetical protein VLI69_07970 [Gammaproteobacteria bacterium]|nr:hypothetical protein [Gammaproteobacteria bacterium]
MNSSLGYKLLKTLYKFLNGSTLTTPNVRNTELIKFNGSTKLINSGQYNLIVNGSATLGSPGHKTSFKGLIVVNGSAKTNNASFDALELNGNGNLKNTEVRSTLHVNGNATLKGCNINSLITYGNHTKIELTDSVIQKKEHIQETQ